jgi:adenosine deaminase
VTAALALATVAAPPSPVLAKAPTHVSQEAQVAARFDAIAADPQQLRIFLREMPKGGDLHNHLAGAIYAEDYIAWAREAGLCLDEAGTALRPPPCAKGRALPPMSGGEANGDTRLIDALSTRGWQHGIGRNDVSGHDQFFGTFERSNAVEAIAVARMLAAERRIAAGDRLSYLELDHDPLALTRLLPAAPEGALDESGLAARFAQERPLIEAQLAAASAELDRDEAASRRELGCDGPEAEPGCAITVRYLFQAFRAVPPGVVFRSLIMAFAMADHDPRYVGINIVMPEDAPVALRDYDLHMAMIRFLAAKYPRVHRSIHAGELAFGMVAPQELRDHIAKAVDAGAQRIGHGVDIAFEDNARGTMARMAREGIAVEINLTSNDVILGIKGADHPLNLYRRMGVPVVLSTDDQGVLRTDMTNEYVRATREQGLRYRDLKQAARASIEYSFVPGASLWQDRRLGAAVPHCTVLASARCASFLQSSEKARLQAELEQRFDVFERRRLADKPTLQ